MIHHLLTHLRAYRIRRLLYNELRRYLRAHPGEYEAIKKRDLRMLEGK